LESYTENKWRARSWFVRENLQFIIDFLSEEIALAKEKKPLIISERTRFHHAEILGIGKFS